MINLVKDLWRDVDLLDKILIVWIIIGVLFTVYMIVAFVFELYPFSII